MIQGQKLTKRLCDAAQAGRREDGTTRERVVFDAGDGSVKGYGLRISPKGQELHPHVPSRPGSRRAAAQGHHRPVRLAVDRRDCAGRRPGASSARSRAVAIRLAIGPRSGRGQGRRRGQGQRARSRRRVDEARPGQEPHGGRGPRIMEREVLPSWGERSLASIRKRDVIEPDQRHRRPRRQDRSQPRPGPRAALLQWAASRDLIEANPAQTSRSPERGPARSRARRWRAGRGVAGLGRHGRAVRRRRAAADPDRRAALRDIRRQNGQSWCRNALALPAGGPKRRGAPHPPVAPCPRHCRRAHGLAGMPVPADDGRTSTRSAASATRRPSSTGTSSRPGRRKSARKPSRCGPGGSTTSPQRRDGAAEAWVYASR